MRSILRLRYSCVSALIGVVIYSLTLTVLYRGQFILGAPPWDLLLVGGSLMTGVTSVLGWNHGETMYVNRAVLNAILTQGRMKDYTNAQQAMVDPDEAVPGLWNHRRAERTLNGPDDQ